MTKIKPVLLTSLIALGLVAGAANAGPRGGMMGEDRPSFAEIDADGSGTLSAEELAAVKTARFAAMDADGDGALSVEEIVAGQKTRRAERMMARLDANDDGLLQLDELSAPGDGKMFSRLDADSDGEVSQEEFETAAEKMQRRGHGAHGGKGGHGGKHGHDRGQGCDRG